MDEYKVGKYVYLPYDGFNPTTSKWSKNQIKGINSLRDGAEYASFRYYGDVSLKGLIHYQELYKSLKSGKGAK